MVEIETQFNEVFDGKQLLYLGNSVIAAPAILGNCFAKEHEAAKAKVLKALAAISLQQDIKFSEVLMGFEEGIEDKSTFLSIAQNASTQKVTSNSSAPNNSRTAVKTGRPKVVQNWVALPLNMDFLKVREAKSIGSTGTTPTTATDAETTASSSTISKSQSTSR
ncbi:hypothetical protein RUND412_002024 [Rhizina undulata]